MAGTHLVTGNIRLALASYYGPRVAPLLINAPAVVRARELLCHRPWRNLAQIRG